MINKYKVKNFCCEDLSKIENYELAIADTENMYDCHHKNEIRELPSGMVALRTREDLIEIGMYFNRPADELIFITHSEHARLHAKHRTYSAETCKRMSESAKKRKASDETRRKLSELGKRRVWSEETRRKLSEKAKARKRKPLSPEHKLHISMSMKKYFQKEDK